jgi:hypothetical protein
MTANECSNCHTRARHNDHRGCCCNCGRLFSGLEAFDRHWYNPAPGTRDCQDPASILDKKGRARYETTPVPGGVAWRLVPRTAHPYAQKPPTEETA